MSECGISPYHESTQSSTDSKAGKRVTENTLQSLTDLKAGVCSLLSWDII